jgi:catechol 2,3-dioxygenase-like lactoylglutathione lyase family enzyme
MKRLFDHVDLRVRSLSEARTFYEGWLAELGFPKVKTTPIGVAFIADRDHPKPEFIGLIEDPTHTPNETRLAFWADTPTEVDRLEALVRRAGARQVEAAAYCPEYSPTYYAVYFEDPCGNRLEICCRVAPVPTPPP